MKRIGETLNLMIDDDDEDDDDEDDDYDDDDGDDDGDGDHAYWRAGGEIVMVMREVPCLSVSRMASILRIPVQSMAIFAHTVGSLHQVDSNDGFPVIYKPPPNYPKSLGQRLLTTAEATTIWWRKPVLCALRNFLQAPRLTRPTVA
ncbi:unnamed protein product [Dibothriocephalus latus]|uniref:Uncharacterized protein n=1 Tax=Dibothriocephalus latus TaxID=60516 RepID=A0A3P7PWB9_DIBLA|nr:unnamed protein product [Dibothriocephalus latus]